jgi:hypothetical protein
VTIAKPEDENAFTAIPPTDAGIAIDIKAEQLKNVKKSILVILFGSVTDDKSVQYSKAFLPIVVTELGIDIDVKLEQPENA